MKLEILGAVSKAGCDEIAYFLNYTNTETEKMLIAEFLRDIKYPNAIATDEIKAVALESSDNLETANCVALAFFHEGNYHILSATYWSNMKEYFKQIL